MVGYLEALYVIHDKKVLKELKQYLARKGRCGRHCGDRQRRLGSHWHAAAAAATGKCGTMFFRFPCFESLCGPCSAVKRTAL